MPWVTNPYARPLGTAAVAAEAAAAVRNPNHNQQQQQQPNPTPWPGSSSRDVYGPAPHPRPGSPVPCTKHSWAATPPAFVPCHPADNEQQQQQQSNVLARPVSMDEDRMANPDDDDEMTTTTRRGRRNQRTNPYAQRPVVVAAAPRASTLPTLSSSLGNRTNTTISLLQPVTALQLLQHERAQRQADPLFLLSLDHTSNTNNNTNNSSYEWLQLHPGVHELCGPAGSGKTQLALSCCRQAAAAAACNNNSNNNSSTSCSSAATAVRALYICLSGNPQASVSQVARRLRQMCEHYDDDDPHILQRIGTRGCTTPEDLLELLRDTLPRQRRTTTSSSSSTTSSISTTASSFSQLRLIVLDSIANLVREDRDMAARSAWLFQVAAALQDLVWDAATTTAPPLSILVLNQVTADWTSSSSSSSLWDQNNNHLQTHYQRREDAWIPALGLSWAHCVHSHFQLDRQPQQQALPCDSHHSNSSSRTVRRLWLAHSARHAGGAALSFVITPAGCQLLVCGDDKNKTAVVPTTTPPTQTNNNNNNPRPPVLVPHQQQQQPHR